MILNKLSLTLAIAFFAVLSWGEPNTSVEDVAFSHASIGIEGGEIYPFGVLEDAVENTLYGGLNFRYAYWENVDGVVMFHYAYFKPVPETVPYDGVHQAMGKVGMDVQLPWINFAKLGAGFACNWTRADLEDEDTYFRYKDFLMSVWNSWRQRDGIRLVRKAELECAPLRKIQGRSQRDVGGTLDPTGTF